MRTITLDIGCGSRTNASSPKIHTDDADDNAACRLTRIQDGPTVPAGPFLQISTLHASEQACSFAHAAAGNIKSQGRVLDHTDVPMNVGVLLDTSTVMSRTLGLEADAASQFFKTAMRPNDQGFLVNYAGHIETLQVPIEDPVRLASKAQDIRKGARIFDDGSMPSRRAPQTRSPFPGRLPVPVTLPPNMPDHLRVAKLYDAVTDSVERFLSREFGRKALVIAALADDAHSESTLRDALKALKENDVIAYVLEVQHAPRSSRDDCDIRHIFRNEEEYRISRLAVETGGRVIRVEGFEKMQAAFEQIADELHHQYSLGYRPTNQDWEGAFRKVSIDAGNGFKVSARDGYYAKPRN